MHVESDQSQAAHLAHDPAAAEWKQDHKLRSDPRIAGLGRFLRGSSPGDLPQLLNAMPGDLTIAGPRPIFEVKMVRYGSFFSAHTKVKSGMIGVWLVSGRNDVSYRRRVAMDALYARRNRLILDARRIQATVPEVINRKGSY